MVCMTDERTSELTGHTHEDVQSAFATQPIVATIEVDRFCEKCGYNLRTQPVRRDPRTEILLCRCPECGRFEYARDGSTAGRVWLNRLGTWMTFGWMALLILAVLALGGAHLGLISGTVDELTRYRPIQMPPTTVPAPQTLPSAGTAAPLVVPGPNGVITVQPIVPTPPQIQIANTVWKRGLADMTMDRLVFLWMMRGLSLATGYTLVLLLLVAAHHWRRWAYVIPLLLMAAAAAIPAWFLVRHEMPELMNWFKPILAIATGLFVLGGLVAVPTGRPLTRRAATILLPPRLRQVLAFLWLADGKPPPRTAGGDSGG